MDLSEVNDPTLGSSSSNGTTVRLTDTVKELYSQIMAALQTDVVKARTNG